MSPIAIHEAAHVTIALVLGVSGGSVSIEVDQSSIRHWMIANPDEVWAYWQECGNFRSYRSVIRGRIIAFMAGAEAEAEVFGICEEDGGKDRYWTGCMLEEICQSGEEQRVEARLRRMARMLVRRHRQGIEQLAEMLDMFRTLSGEELDRYMQQVGFTKHGAIEP